MKVLHLFYVGAPGTAGDKYAASPQGQVSKYFT